MKASGDRGKRPGPRPSAKPKPCRTRRSSPPERQAKFGLEAEAPIAAGPDAPKAAAPASASVDAGSRSAGRADDAPAPSSAPAGMRAVCWDLSEPDALVLSRSLEMSPSPSALEQGWPLAELKGSLARLGGGCLEKGQSSRFAPPRSRFSASEGRQPLDSVKLAGRQPLEAADRALEAPDRSSSSESCDTSFSGRSWVRISCGHSAPSGAAKRQS